MSDGTDCWVFNTDNGQYVPIDHRGVIRILSGTFTKPTSGELIGEIKFVNYQMVQTNYDIPEVFGAVAPGAIST